VNIGEQHRLGRVFKPFALAAEQLTPAPFELAGQLLNRLRQINDHRVTLCDHRLVLRDRRVALPRLFVQWFVRHP